MPESKMNENYYKGLHEKVKRYNYTIMSVVSDDPESSEHAAYCYTIGLSNYNHPEIMFADCYYDDVITVTEMILDNISKGLEFPLGEKLEANDSVFKSIELLNGVKEELTPQAEYYFNLFRPNQKDYDLIYMGKSDELGVFPDEKIFIESKHIKRVFFKQTLFNGKSLGTRNFVMPQIPTIQW